MGQDGVVWSNADEVVLFLEEHLDRKYEVGETLVLPDIYQEFEVIAVRPFKRGKSFYLFLDIEASCAVLDCDEKFVCSYEVHRWRAARYMTRSCPAHMRQFRSEMPHAWKTSDERRALSVAGDRELQRKAVLAEIRARPRMGVVERAVMDAYEDAAVVQASVHEDQLVAAAAAKVPRPVGRDTRKQRTVRALDALCSRGLLLRTGRRIIGFEE